MNVPISDTRTPVPCAATSSVTSRSLPTARIAYAVRATVQVAGLLALLSSLVCAQAGSGSRRQIEPGGEISGAGRSVPNVSGLVNIIPELGAGDPDLLTAVGDRVFFSNRSDAELWTSDGSADGTIGLEIDSGTMRALNFLRSSAISPPNLTLGIDLNGSLLFDGQSPDSFGDSEPWISDGTVDGTFALAQTRMASGPIPSFMDPLQFQKHAGRGYFSSYVRSPGVLWETDGTVDGTVALGQFSSPPRGDLFGFDAVAATETMLFRVSTAGGNRSLLYSLDSVGEDTFLIDFTKYISPAPPIPRGIVELNGQVFLAGADLEHGDEPWVTDGTVDGTRLLADINTDTHELARIGTPQGILEVGDPSYPRDFTVAGDRVFLFADDGEHGVELWSTDGRASRTRMVRDINPGPDSSVEDISSPFGDRELTTSHMVAFRDRAVFVADNGATGNELWITDGPETGARPIRDIVPGAVSSTPSELTVIDDRIVFTACDDRGCEPWVSDGTALGTRQLLEVAVGPESSNPEQYTAAGDLVYFITESSAGRELWAVRRALVTTGYAACLGDCNVNGQVDVSELIVAVRISLGLAENDTCPFADGDQDGAVRINELIGGVRSLLDGCADLQTSRAR